MLLRCNSLKQMMKTTLVTAYNRGAHRYLLTIILVIVISYAIVASKDYIDQVQREPLHRFTIRKTVKLFFGAHDANSFTACNKSSTYVSIDNLLQSLVESSIAEITNYRTKVQRKPVNHFMTTDGQHCVFLPSQLAHQRTHSVLH